MVTKILKMTGMLVASRVSTHTHTHTLTTKLNQPSGMQYQKFLDKHIDNIVIILSASVKHVQGCADKSLARPGRKQTTANKLGIYSAWSPRSSIHFLARCSNFCKPLKKKLRMLSVQPGLRGSNDPHFGRKMVTFQLFFQSREQVVVRRGQIRRVRCVIKTLEAQVDQFLLGCKCLVSWGIQRTTSWLGVFFFIS